MRRPNNARRSRLRTVTKSTAVVAGAAGLAAGALYVGPFDGTSPRSGDSSQAVRAGAAEAGAGADETRTGLEPAGRAPNLTDVSARQSTGAAADALTARLGGRTAGAYVDAAGRTVVTVTNATDAAVVRAAGAVPKQMLRSPATLNRTTAALRRSMTGMTGTGWAVDPATSQVVVWTDASVTGTRMTTVRRATQQMGSAVRTVRIPGRLRTFALGGEAIFGGGSRCSLGFNVRRGTQDFFLTAGHCGNIVRNWTADQQGAQALGSTVDSSFPGNDFALVESAPGAGGEGEVNLFNGRSQDITEAGDAVVGQPVVRSGSTTGIATGQVTAVNATVNFPEGTVTGMTQTTVCAEPGDSGGPLFSGSTALGLTSGGSGDCRVGGVTFYQPVTEALQTFDVQVF